MRILKKNIKDEIDNKINTSNIRVFKNMYLRHAAIKGENYESSRFFCRSRWNRIRF